MSKSKNAIGGFRTFMGCLAISMLALGGCGPGEIGAPGDLDSQEQRFSSIEWLFPVHQPITESAIDIVRDWLYSRRNHPLLANLSAPYKYDMFVERFVLRGNTATDCQPSCDDTINSLYPETAWDLPAAHFMRLAGITSKNACEDSKNYIVQATLRAFRGYPELFSKWIGHATHILQDSFTASHAHRSGYRAKSLRELCVSGGGGAEGTCTHGIPGYVMDPSLVVLLPGHADDIILAHAATVGYLSRVALLRIWDTNLRICSAGTPMPIGSCSDPIVQLFGDFDVVRTTTGKEYVRNTQYPRARLPDYFISSFIREGMNQEASFYAEFSNLHLPGVDDGGRFGGYFNCRNADDDDAAVVGDPNGLDPDNPGDR